MVALTGACGVDCSQSGLRTARTGFKPGPDQRFRVWSELHSEVPFHRLMEPGPKVQNLEPCCKPFWRFPVHAGMKVPSLNRSNVHHPSIVLTHSSQRHLRYLCPHSLWMKGQISHPSWVSTPNQYHEWHQQNKPQEAPVPYPTFGLSPPSALLVTPHHTSVQSIPPPCFSISLQQAGTHHLPTFAMSQQPGSHTLFSMSWWWAGYPVTHHFHWRDG